MQALGGRVDVDLLLGGDPGVEDGWQETTDEIDCVAYRILADSDRELGLQVRAGLKTGLFEGLKEPHPMFGCVPSLPNAS